MSFYFGCFTETVASRSRVKCALVSNAFKRLPRPWQLCTMYRRASTTCSFELKWAIHVCFTCCYIKAGTLDIDCYWMNDAFPWVDQSSRFNFISFLFFSADDSQPILDLQQFWKRWCLYVLRHQVWWSSVLVLQPSSSHCYTHHSLSTCHSEGGVLDDFLSKRII